MEKPMTRENALALIAQLQFRPFSKADWQSFAGAESENPLIAENDEYLVVLDGNIVEFYVVDKEEIFQFSLQNL